MRFVAIAVTLVALAVGAVPAQADYPSQAIKIVHGSSAGAPQDVMLRQLAESMSEVAGVPVVVEPRPGGTGQVAISYMLGQSADGYTIFSDATGITTVLQLPGAAHALTDLKPLYRVQLDPFALYIQRDGEYDSLDDLLAAMEERPEHITIGGYGTGSPHQITSIFLADKAGVELNWVPYDSGADAIAAVMAGDLDAAMSNISVYGRFKDRTKVIATTSEGRIEAFSDVPTFQELGFDLVRYHWRGQFVHPDTPDEVVGTLYDIIDQAAQTESFQKYLETTATIPGTMTREDFEALLEEQAKDDRATLQRLGML